MEPPPRMTLVFMKLAPMSMSATASPLSPGLFISYWFCVVLAREPDGVGQLLGRHLRDRDPLRHGLAPGEGDDGGLGLDPRLLDALPDRLGDDGRVLDGALADDVAGQGDRGEGQEREPAPPPRGPDPPHPARSAVPPAGRRAPPPPPGGPPRGQAARRGEKGA